MKFLGTIIIVISSYFVSCQENAGTNIASALRECYNTTQYVTRDYRLPASINVLIDLIRRIEDGNPTQDARELSYQMLQRFRQDGIRRTTKDLDSSQGIPYSPKGWETYKNKVQLSRITPGNALNFNNNSLSSLQSCSLHFMVSSSISAELRGDEQKSCNQVARYTDRRHKRAVEPFETDVSTKSSCPIESGVIFTKWGAVKAGTVLAGIAAGFQPNPIRVSNVTLESSYASTLAGELSETLLNQLQSTKTVGNKGSWNSTVVPKYYFVQSNTKDDLYFTDAEIRGALDGLFISLNIQNWKSKASNIKISQILDLYYGRGIFNDTSRACNRKALTQTLVSDDKLVWQTVGYSYILNEKSTLPYSPTEENFPTMAKAVISSLQNYLGSLNDLACSAEDEYIQRTATDILVFIDTAWDYTIIQPLVSYILENIDINNYESSYTILDGANGEIIVNKSRSILDYYENFNLTQQQKYPTGFDYNKVVQVAETIYRAKLTNATDLSGQSTILLMLPHNSPSTSQSDYVQTRRDAFRYNLPDFRILVAGSDSKTAYNSLVTNPTTDIFTVSQDSSDATIKSNGQLIIDRIKQLPRNVVNPSCGTSFSSGVSNFEVIQYVEPSGINYHRISPNYFFDGQSLKIRGQGYGTLIVCTSRTEANPKPNTTTTDGTTCKTINSDEYALDISSYCTDETVVNCSPIYISVQGDNSLVRCTDKLCRFPDSIKYTIALENVQCSSSGEVLITSFLLIITLLSVIHF